MQKGSFRFAWNVPFSVDVFVNTSIGFLKSVFLDPCSCWNTYDFTVSQLELSVLCLSAALGALVFEKPSVTHRSKQPSLCYCTLFGISLTVNTLMGFDLTSSFVSVWLTLPREGRRCVDKMAHSVIGAWGCVPVKTKTCLQVRSMYVPELCSWSIWLRLVVCSKYLFLCNYRLAMLKGVLHAGRSALVSTREFVWCYSPFIFLSPVLIVCLSSALVMISFHFLSCLWESVCRGDTGFFMFVVWNTLISLQSYGDDSDNRFFFFCRTSSHASNFSSLTA